MRLLTTGLSRAMIVIAVAGTELAVIACRPATWEIAVFTLSAAAIRFCISVQEATAEHCTEWGD